MPESELMNQLPQFLLYLVLAVFVVGFVLRQAAEASESFAKLFGPLGRFWRRKIEAERRRLEQEREDRVEAFKLEAKTAMQSELGVVRKSEYEALKQDLIRILDRVADMERKEAIYEAYLVADGSWHREINIRLAEIGVLQAPLPDRVPFSEFEDAYRKKRGWHKPR